MRNRLGILYKIKWSNTCFKLKCEGCPPLPIFNRACRSEAEIYPPLEDPDHRGRSIAEIYPPLEDPAIGAQLNCH